MKKIISVLLTSFLAVAATAQNNVGTPYSKYGIGLLPENYGAYVGMGGVSAAMRDRHNINYLNPASYTALDSFRFYFQAGYAGEHVNISSYYARATYSVAQTASINMGFRLAKKLFASFGFNERSDIGYDMRFTNQVAGDPYSFFYQLIEGEGGLNDAYFGLGYQWGKLSIGVNASYIFGKVEDRQTLQPISLAGNPINYYVKTRTQNHIHDVLFTFGAQYPVRVSESSLLTLGGTYNFGTYLSGKRVFEAYELTTSEKDTLILREVPDHGKIFYPARFTLGGSYEWNYRWMISGDYTFQEMKKYKEFGEVTDMFTNYHKLAIGGAYTPNGRYWWQRNRYMAGSYFTKSHINLLEHNINTFGVTLGVQIPFYYANQELMLGVAADAGVRGRQAAGLMMEQFAKIRLTIAFKERWFMKPKIF
ncbi:MAG: hypothetical protein LBD64_06205 [Odoribacteraceae bacterium]|jgi:hypothetical protein|nr:hypothetical protein [Odoribacteraceae bacterium]